ncbi:MAG TPA: hypothetical protein VJA26_18220, partial [Gammaproteobacteria bacterium]|nr:hypothetical protein [Gammaproteobacteria bacterium]
MALRFAREVLQHSVVWRQVTVACAVLAILGMQDRVWSQEEEEELEPFADSPAELHLIDTGEGQSVLLDLGEVEIVIDGGEGRSVLRDYLDETELIDGAIDLVVVSHTDIDAYEGLAELIEPRSDSSNAPLAIKTMWLPGEYRTEDEIGAEATRARTSCPLTRRYSAFLELAQRVGDVRPVTEVHEPAVATGKATEFE